MVTRSRGMALNLKMKEIAFCHPRSKNRLAVSDAISSKRCNLTGRKKKEVEEFIPAVLSKKLHRLR